MQTEEPRIVKSHDIHIDTDYANWIAEVKHRYRSAQVKAAVKVNAEKLLFNWQLGRDLVQKKAEERWGAGVVEQVSLDLKREFPDAEGFSARNLWYMKQWYFFYTQDDFQILQRAGAELQRIESQNKVKMHQLGAETETKRFYQLGEDFPLPFAFVPWRHHVEIITKCKSIEEALFYIGKIIEQGLSRDALINCIKANLYGYIVCELKARPFEPEFAGKLNYYVNAVDELMKSDDDNPTIGLLVCSDMDKIDVQWSFRGINTPMGVATYNNIRIKDALPSQEHLAERVRLLQKELKEAKRLMNKV